MNTLGSQFLMIIGGFEVVFGLLVVIGKWIPVALTFISAITLNAVIFHFLKDDVANSIGAVVALILALTLIFLGYNDRFKEYLRF